MTLLEETVDMSSGIRIFALHTTALNADAFP